MNPKQKVKLKIIKAINYCFYTLIWLLQPVNYVLKLIDKFLIKFYFSVIHLKKVKAAYKKYIAYHPDGWRAASELQFFYDVIVFTYSLQPFFPIKTKYFKLKFLKKIPFIKKLPVAKKLFFISYPGLRKSATVFLQNIDQLNKNITQKHSIKKPGRNDKCLCGSGKNFKKCCLKSWNEFNTDQPKIRKYEAILKRPKNLPNPIEKALTSK